VALISIIVVSLSLIAAPVPISNFPATWFLADHLVEGWSGYVVETPPGAVTEVEGAWVVPQVSCTDAPLNATFAVAVGIDGVGTDSYPNLAGVEVTCGSSGTEYFPFYYWGGAGHKVTTIVVEPKDLIKVGLSWRSDHFETTINNTDRHWTVKRNSPIGISSPKHSAEWVIVGTQGTGGKLPVPNFGTVPFSDCYAMIGGTVGSIDSFPLSSLVKDVMIDKSRNVQARPSLPSWFDGSSFSVQWFRLGP